MIENPFRAHEIGNIVGVEMFNISPPGEKSSKAIYL